MRVVLSIIWDTPPADEAQHLRREALEREVAQLASKLTESLFSEQK